MLPKLLSGYSPSSWVVDVQHAQFGLHFFKVDLKKSFGEDVDCLKSCWHVSKSDNPLINLLFNETTVNLHMFSHVMMNRIFSNTNYSLIVTKKFS